MHPLWTLLELKWTLAKNSAAKLVRRSPVEFVTLLIFLVGAGLGLYFLFYHAFHFFHGQKPFGPILIDESFYLFNFALFLMLMISSGVSAHASLFRSQEVPFLLTRTVEWKDVYFIKLTETFWFSAWSLLFITLPFMTAFGVTRGVSVGFFPVLCLAFYVPFAVLAITLGSLLSLIVTRLLPNRRRRQIALAVVLALTVYLFIKTQPQVIQEQASISGVLSGYLPHVAAAKHALLPSTWVTKGILSMAQLIKQGKENLWDQGLFYFLLLLSNMLFFLIPSLWAGSRLYAPTYLAAQDHAEAGGPRKTHFQTSPVQWYDHLPWPSRPAMAFLEKDVKTFLRDPSEWSQLIIFFGLLLIYFLNLRNLEFHVLKDMWKNLIFVLNTVGTYIVLSSFSMRFVFPMLSMEGSRAWMIGLAPISFASLLLEKFFLGTAASVILTLPLVFLSGWMLDISLGRVLITTGLGFFVCVALTGLSVGFGTRFPNFKSNNPSEIISGFGGSMLLVVHLTYLISVGILLVANKQLGWPLAAGMMAGSLLTALIPLKVGMRALQKMEF